MLTYVTGNLFDSPAKVLVNTVNTVGVMGKGIALTFKQIYPEMFDRYVALCETRQFDVGKLWLYRTSNKWVLNFPTKKDWRRPSKLEYIEAGLEKFVATYAEENITSIAFPELGCGNGELLWEDVEPVMNRYLRPLPITVYIYRYDGARGKAEHQNVAEMRKWLRAEPRTLAFEEFWSDIKEVVGSNPELAKPTGGELFAVSVVRYDTEGLLLHLGERSQLQIWRDVARKLANEILQKWSFASKGKREIFIPQAAFLELWQSIRFYGFCYSKMMPDGLDVLAEYLIPVLQRLDYLRPVDLSSSSGSKAEPALQLYVPVLPEEPKIERVQAASA